MTRRKRPAFAPDVFDPEPIRLVRPTPPPPPAHTSHCATQRLPDGPQGPRIRVRWTDADGRTRTRTVPRPGERLDVFAVAHAAAPTADLEGFAVRLLHPTAIALVRGGQGWTITHSGPPADPATVRPATLEVPPGTRTRSARRTAPPPA